MNTKKYFTLIGEERGEMKKFNVYNKCLFSFLSELAPYYESDEFQTGAVRKVCQYWSCTVLVLGNEETKKQLEMKLISGESK